MGTRNQLWRAGTAAGEQQQGGDAVFARIPSIAASTPAVGGVRAAGFFDYPLLRDAWLRRP
ncbi:hypothetical protein R0595_002536 [Pluralibacter gergoviae]|nr:hypothetical protein [Pluralibacter gergoviae]ELW9443446.1 hypothetical protein [Pluralibacter gergoviae]